MSDIILSEEDLSNEDILRQLLKNSKNVNFQVILGFPFSELDLQLRPSLNLPNGIDQFKKFAPQNEYSNLALELPFRPLQWKTGRNLPRLVCSLSSKDIPNYPSLSRIIDLSLRSHPLFENSSYQSAWINQYRDGQDWTPYHQDSYNSSVMMISVGEKRTLLTKKISVNGEKVPRAQSWECEDGDITIFTPEWNDNHQHSIPKRKNVNQGRISIVVFLN